ncbi:hypothetical protein ABK040_015040 [Willaertia magna]
MSSILREVGKAVDKVTPNNLLTNIKNTLDISNITNNNNHHNANYELYDDIITAKRVNQIEKKFKDDENEILTNEEIQQILYPFSELEFHDEYYINTLLDKNKYNKRMEKRLLKFENIKNNLQKFNFTKNTDADNENNNSDGVDDLDDLDDDYDYNNEENNSPTTTSLKMKGLLKNAAKTTVTHLNPAVAGKKIAKEVTGVGTKLMKVTIDTGKKIAKEVTEAGHNTEDFLKGKKFQHLQLEKIQKIMKHVKDHNEVVLLKMKTTCSNTLITDVYNHYGVFIQTSKHIDKMDRELVELGNLWNEMKRHLTGITNLITQPVIVNNSTTVNNNSLQNKKNIDKDVDTVDEDIKDKVLTKIKELTTEFYNTLQIRDFESSIKIYDFCRRIVEQYMINPKENNSSKNNFNNKLNNAKNRSNNLENEEELNYEENDINIINNFNNITKQFIDLLIVELQNCENTNDSELIVKYLCVLNYREEAISIYLQSQSELIDDMLSNISIGDPLTLAFELSKRFFYTISIVCENFLKIFGNSLQNSLQQNTQNNNTQQKDNKNKYQGLHHSGFMKWIFSQIIEKFCKKFKRNISEVVNFQDLTKCLSIAFEQAEILTKKGIFVKSILQDFFKRDLEISIVNYFDKKNEDLYEIVMKENWKEISHKITTRNSTKNNVTKNNKNNNLQEQDENIKLTKSGKFLYELIEEYINYIKAIKFVTIYQISINCIKNIIEDYFIEIFKISYSQLSDKNFCNLICNIINIRFHYLPYIMEQLKSIFEIEIIPILNLMNTTNDLEEKILERYCENRIDLILEQMKLNLKNNYPPYLAQNNNLQNINLENLNVSLPFIKFLDYVRKIKLHLDNYNELSKTFMVPSKMIEFFIKNLQSSSRAYFWKQLNTNSLNNQNNNQGTITPLNELQVHIILLDLYFIQMVCGDVVLTDETKESLQLMKQKVIDTFSKRQQQLNNNSDNVNIKLEEGVYTKIIQKAMQENENVKNLVKFFRELNSYKKQSNSGNNNTINSSPSTSSSPQMNVNNTTSTSSSNNNRRRY